MKPYRRAAVLLAVLTVAGSTSADPNGSLPLSASAAPGSGSLPSTPRADNRPQALSGQQMSYAFNGTSAMPEWRARINNTSVYDYKVTITKGSPTGPSSWSGTIPKGQSYNIWSDYAYPADTYYVNLTCGSGAMSGSVAARVASTHAEVLP
ncbi:hypothetical protein [Paenibacillus glufosinatiresistens]|uniref:hypothetical protein n=1 Tax=Paenibacillus glufosinatiresistens TaxID=3070657 RepID=UPI00286DC503|nr:hypothetical protein [Paenibacillus sp. YX.27]